MRTFACRISSFVEFSRALRLIIEVSSEITQTPAVCVEKDIPSEAIIRKTADFHMSFVQQCARRIACARVSSVETRFWEMRRFESPPRIRATEFATRMRGDFSALDASNDSKAIARQGSNSFARRRKSPD
jgi:hypothetical protein